MIRREAGNLFPSIFFLLLLRPFPLHLRLLFVLLCLSPPLLLLLLFLSFFSSLYFVFVFSCSSASFSLSSLFLSSSSSCLLQHDINEVM